MSTLTTKVLKTLTILRKHSVYYLEFEVCLSETQFNLKDKIYGIICKEDFYSII